MFNFYLFQANKKIIISNYPLEKIREKFGFRFEILNSVKEESAIGIVTERIKRNYPLFSFETYIKRPRPPITDEIRKKMSLAKMGKPRDPETKRKISLKRKGKGNFQGKRHREESKQKIGEKQVGNSNVKDRYWIHDPNSDLEKRIKDRNEVPEGFSLGRDYYSTEAFIYVGRQYLRSRNR